MTKSQIRALLVLAGIATLVYLSGKVELPEETRVSSSPTKVVKVVQQPASEFKELNQEETIAFVRQILERELQEYPVLSVRTKLQDAGKQAQEKGLKIHVSEKTHGNALMAAYWMDGKPYMNIYVGRLNFMRKMHHEHPDILVDEIVAASLHEFYHLFQQDWINWDAEGSLEYRMKIESEAWWYVTEEVYWPMIRGGRLNADPMHWSGAVGKPIIAYKESNGDPTHPAWQSFIRIVTSK